MIDAFRSSRPRFQSRALGRKLAIGHDGRQPHSLASTPVPSAPSQRNRRAALSIDLFQRIMCDQRIMLWASKRPSRPHWLQRTRRSACQRIVSSGLRKMITLTANRDRNTNYSVRSAWPAVLDDSPAKVSFVDTYTALVEEMSLLVPHPCSPPTKGSGDYR